MNYFVLMMLMGVKSDDMKLYHISKGGWSQIKDLGSHHVRESAKKNLNYPKTSEPCIEVNVSKQRSNNINIVSHQIGVGTRKHELAIENNLQKRAYQLVCLYSSYKETAKSKAKNREFSTWE